MAWVEKVKLLPEMSGSDIDKMTKALTTRFATVAKKFGSGLVSAITGGGIVGAALALVDKLISPLKAIQEAIDATLDKGNDITVRAKEFGSTPAEIAKLHAMGQATGNTPDQINLWLEKFKTAVEEATANPGEHSAVRNFVGTKDYVQAFLTFADNLKKESPLQQGLIQTEVLGNRQKLQAAEFFQADLPKLQRKFSGINDEGINAGANNADVLKTHKNTLEAYSGLQHFVTRANQANDDMITSVHTQSENKENAQDVMMKSFKSLQMLDANVDKMLIQLQKGVVALTSLAVKFAPVSEAAHQERKRKEVHPMPSFNPKKRRVMF